MEFPQTHLTVSHRSQTYNLSLNVDATVQVLQEQLSELTAVPPHLQKLLYKGKKNLNPEMSLGDAGIVDGAKITLLGNPESAIGELLDAEKQQKRKEDILKARAAGPAPKVRPHGYYSRVPH
jgi:Ubiquitin family